jgi:hypothetical protein
MCWSHTGTPQAHNGQQLLTVAKDLPALQLRELWRTWRVTTSPKGRPIATTQSACPRPRMSMVPKGSRCCLPQTPAETTGEAW